MSSAPDLSEEEDDVVLYELHILGLLNNNNIHIFFGIEETVTIFAVSCILIFVLSLHLSHPF